MTTTLRVQEDTDGVPYVAEGAPAPPVPDVDFTFLVDTDPVDVLPLTDVGVPLALAALVVPVVTGEEARPAAVFVLWLGGASEPTHMGARDLWAPAPA